MPVSDMMNVGPIMREVALLQPKSILDLGIGFGKYGALCREVLDATYGRCSNDEWTTFICGFEAHHEYDNPLWQMYSHILRRDFTEEDWSSLEEPYDLVLMIDSLEHIEKEKGRTLLNDIIKYNKNVIVSCPDGDYPQGAVFGNEYERHRAVWTGKELHQMGGKILYHGVCTVCRFEGKAK